MTGRHDVVSPVRSHARRWTEAIQGRLVIRAISEPARSLADPPRRLIFVLRTWPSSTGVILPRPPSRCSATLFPNILIIAPVTFIPDKRDQSVRRIADVADAVNFLIAKGLARRPIVKTGGLVLENSHSELLRVA